MGDKKTEEAITQFCSVTSATTKEAKKFIDKYKRLDVAIDAYYTNPNEFGNRRQAESTAVPSTSKLNALFTRYKDADGDEISVDGTIKLCEDLEVNPEDVVLLAIAYELKSERVGEWKKQGWIEGWKNLHCDSIPSMRSALGPLRSKLGGDSTYFQKVYNHTFDFARNQGQRSLSIENAQAFWGLLLPHGFSGGALSHVESRDDDNDVQMSGARDGFKEEYIQWWFDFLNVKGGKGVSKDTWQMLFDFIRTINYDFSNYDMEAAWPSTFDDFVEYAKERLTSSG